MKSPYHIEVRIGALCRERGISADELARQIACSRSTARRLMTDTIRRIHRQHLADVCRVLNVTPGDVLVLIQTPEKQQS